MSVLGLFRLVHHCIHSHTHLCNVSLSMSVCPYVPSYIHKPKPICPCILPYTFTGCLHALPTHICLLCVCFSLYFVPKLIWFVYIGPCVLLSLCTYIYVMGVCPSLLVPEYFPSYMQVAQHYTCLPFPAPPLYSHMFISSFHNNVLHTHACTLGPCPLRCPHGVVWDLHHLHCVDAN